MTSKERCSGRANSDGWGRTTQCANNAVLTEDGEPYCHQHAPSLIAQRKAKRDAAWAAKMDAAGAAWAERERRRQSDGRKLAAYDALLAACEAARTFLAVWQANPAWQAEADAVFAQLEAAIAQARGETP